jgi:hypothetical protein
MKVMMRLPEGTAIWIPSEVEVRQRSTAAGRQLLKIAVAVVVAVPALP